MMLGSEGRFGVLTEVVVRVPPLAEEESFHVAFMRSWEAGVAAVKAMAQAKLPLSMLRLSNAVETHTQLQLAGKHKLVAVLRRYLAIRGRREVMCMLTSVVTDGQTI